MSRHDWYRLTTWSESDQEKFFERLGRSRTLFHKSQYVRIQASYLKDAGYVRESLELLDRLFDEWPDESQLTAAHWQEANCYLALDDLDSAVDAYRRCFQKEDENGIDTNARIEFLWLVATRELSELYDEALEAIHKYDTPMMFPLNEYRYGGGLALIYNELGETARAAKLARHALEAASKTDSGLRYHKGLGLVINPDRKIIRKLKKLAAAGHS